MKPQNFEEKVIWYYITGTYVLYFLGAQFVAAPLVAWVMVLYLGKKLWEQTEQTPPEEKITIPLGVWIWIVGMAIVGIALIGGHIGLGYGLTRIIKSFINFFMRTWALLALFPLIGCLKIRPQLLYRAASILGLQTLIMLPIAYLLSSAGVAMPLYVNSLLAKVGGIGGRYYAVSLYVLEEGSPRLTLIAPWAPALAFAACIHFFLASQDADWRWRWAAMIGSAAAVWGSGSRLGLVCIISLPIIQFVLVNVSRPIMQIAGGLAIFLAGLFGAQLLILARDFKDYFDSQRASSSRVRGVLADLALYKWQTDAPIWGHALKSSQGPEVAAGMPIGSHHTWFGVLYLHGIIGFIGLVVPMLYSFISLAIKAQRSKIAQTGLAILLVMFMFSMGENLEGLAYLYWPGLVMLGIALKERVALSFPLSML
jgi:hypothetical protein